MNARSSTNSLPLCEQTPPSSSSSRGFFLCCKSMASDLVTKAKEAFIDDHFELAVDLYSQAILIDPTNADLFSDRAQANIKLHNFTEAVSDANKAIELDRSNPKAYLRKGTACFNLEEYQTAKTAFEAGAALVPEDKRFGEWIKKCDNCIAEENDELSTPSPAATSAEVVAKTDAAPKETEPVNNVTPAKPKYRHEFYQKPEEVVVTIFAKGIPAESVTVNYGEQILSVSIDVPGEEKYVFQPRLFGKIVPANCKYNILSTKIEIRLAKVEPIHWTSLEFNNNIVVARSSIVSTGNRRPVYPSSKPTKDWDKLEAQVKKEEKDEKLDGDAALNKFFREIYSDADEDTRRAMSKSFVESNGTVLSTNWKEVGAKEVEGTPPDGMELKKWEY
ncbi:putative CS domain, SGS domain, HSP20-like chaperone, tetratricopeptide repeat-containing [Helianthus annuus]|uniref:Protein SGT1 homolog n=2 Tax=Helianthus annuus TaxID=4232 RepID=A0A251SNZ1_HELAN|nr:putative CS domain, SGS domain, HSP20-like chaperone, tetratricopeptide repeat-containing [Helianthus annuus]KAJ0496728.1 putative CS domain, SGS domain, HSP20-like chaperone, tetratricopeptide repeat-containing [Helianthus annuus]KAJ0670285.1 putative CS domain, SGS domain, HSP20-like chaperone, tetratricopeptide repeat-containing [Helianthus annuus]